MNQRASFKDRAENLCGKEKYQTIINQTLKDYIAGAKF